jgi:hypothetical protein
MHGLHRTCETIYVLYANVGNLVDYGKRALVKSPAKVEVFKTK